MTTSICAIFKAAFTLLIFMQKLIARGATITVQERPNRPVDDGESESGSTARDGNPESGAEPIARGQGASAASV